jgi:hypothetical protein
VQAPFADPTFYVVTGFEPADEKRYRSWARPLAKKQTMIALALGATTSAGEWLDRSGVMQHPADGQTLIEALALASSLAEVYMSGLDYALSTEPDTTLGGVLEVVDGAIVTATNILRG